uniref:Reverse transcriptase domain-containing protein n=1 Tax=Sparus aurata TaxID=8175 RepID=A0A671W1X3_SPAAU
MTGMKTSTCVLDPIPSHFIKDSLPVISTLITDIINSSLRSGSVPHSLKLAAVTPILKKPGHNPDIMSNFRPISNLPFLSKILEHIVATQLKAHLCSNDLLEPFQSGFRSKHSTETALLKVTNDILLDLTTAFDTINHTILLSRLESSLSITGTALSWLKSYLTDRQQFIHINKCASSTVPLSQGIPQGSVLGPLIFILYLFPLGNIMVSTSTAMLMMSSFISPPNPSPLATHSTLSNCLTIKSWMQTNFLKLNCDKSDLIIIGPKSLTKTTDSFCLTIDNSTLSPSPHSRNLGVIFDNNLSFEPSHQPNHQNCLLQPQEHCPTPPITLLLCCRNPHPRLHHLQNRLQHPLWHTIQNSK